MKNIIKRAVALITIFAIALTLAMPATAEARSKKTPKLNKTKVTLTITKKNTKPAVHLKVRYTAGKRVKWYLSNKDVATVSKKGKVVAKKKGTVVVKAKVGKKTLACKVTIKDSRFVSTRPQTKKDYGVFLSVDASAMKKLSEYKTVVIDAQYFSKQDIQTLHKNGTTVYTYLNIGSIENFRNYYSEYKDLTIGDYENWDEEQWVDVSSPRWQSFIADLSNSLSKKGVDGFFIDNCDVYYIAHNKNIFNGLSKILRNIKALGKAVVINGGDTYITQYRKQYGSAKDVMTAVNQEEVFSLINFDTSSFGKNTAEETAYFSDYVEACSNDGMDVYLLEYTTDRGLIAKIKSYCRKKRFHYYISDSIELD